MRPSGLFFALVSWPMGSYFGRKITLVVSGTAYFIGGILVGFAQNLAMLVIGRVLLGVGTGLANCAGPLYLSEMPPCAPLSSPLVARGGGGGRGECMDLLCVRPEHFQV